MIWHINTFIVLCVCVNAVMFKNSHAGLALLCPALPFGSQAPLPQQPEGTHTKEKAGYQFESGSHQSTAWTHTYTHIYKIGGGVQQRFLWRLNSIHNHVVFTKTLSSPFLPLLPAFWCALSLRVCVPAGSDSSSSHLVLGKLGYANNISAQNISTTSSSGGEEQWPSYSTADPAYLHNPWPCCYPPVGACDSERKRKKTCRHGVSEKETAYVRMRLCIG